MRMGRAALGIVAATLAGPVLADGPWDRPTLSLLGTAGMIDMPTAYSMPDGELSFTVAAFQRTQRNTLTFQITPRLSGSFRYVYLDDYEGLGNYYDRSLDLRYQLVTEGPRRPAIAIGLQDFGGTGIYSGEFIVASKTFGRLRANAGIGWGRFGSYNGFDNPLSIFSDSFDVRPEQTGGISQTGQLDANHWFRGDAALFGGLQYAASDRLILTAEYSSDAYVNETERLDFERKSPINLGLTYRFRNGLDLSAAYLYGSDLSVQLSYGFDPKNPSAFPGGLAPTPVPVFARAPGAARDLGWTQVPEVASATRTALANLMEADGLRLDGLDLSGRRAVITFRNPSYGSSAQALGRAARSATVALPASIEEFVLVPVSAEGIAAASVTLSRTDLETLEYAPDGAWQAFARADIADAAAIGDVPAPEGLFPEFRWSVAPYVDTILFDPDAPVRPDFGIEANARFEPAPGWVLDGQVRARIAANVDGVRPSNSVIQKVRSDIDKYLAEGDVAITRLTAARYFRPGPDLYGRVTVGYLEMMYGGVSGELLWKPVDSRLGIGAELNYAVQRDFDQQFGFQDYDVVTGHVSAYWDAPGPFHYQLDAGRYLAGDWGATFTIDREFGNGIRVGAFATFTDVSFEDFGEGSFDKGIRIDIPVNTISGGLGQDRIDRTIRPVLRDGGARLEVDGRLYEMVRDYHQPRLQDQWGMFWR